MVQGINYPAAVLDNLHPDRITPENLVIAEDLFNEISEDCPNSRIIFSGYSQGGGLVHSVTPVLTPQQREQITIAISYGSTRAWQDSFIIMGLPEERFKVNCNPLDRICTKGSLITFIWHHFQYFHFLDEDMHHIDERLLADANKPIRPPTKFERYVNERKGPMTFRPAPFPTVYVTAVVTQTTTLGSGTQTTTFVISTQTATRVSMMTRLVTQTTTLALVRTKTTTVPYSARPMPHIPGEWPPEPDPVMKNVPGGYYPSVGPGIRPGVPHNAPQFYENAPHYHENAPQNPQHAPQRNQHATYGTQHNQHPPQHNQHGPRYIPGSGRPYAVVTR